jgi:hypothetical protein
LIKNIPIQIHQQSWQTARPPQYQKTCPFPKPTQVSALNFGRAMLWIGMMSVLSRMPQWWAASLWAVCRYFAAVDETIPELRLHEFIEDIDTHPKKVLSDDWGTGVAIEWLDSQFQYQYVGHGRNAMLELQRQNLASYVGKQKRGPQKCPDFFCIDAGGGYHLVECKGNQSGPQESDSQFVPGQVAKIKGPVHKRTVREPAIGHWPCYSQPKIEMEHSACGRRSSIEKGRVAPAGASREAGTGTHRA